MKGRCPEIGNRRSRSLRGRLILVPTAIMMIGFVTLAGVVILQAHARIAAETGSSMALGRDLISIATLDASLSEDPARAVDRLARRLPRVRHVRFDFIPAAELMPRGTPPRSEQARDLPVSWLSRILSPPAEEQIFPVMVRERTIGEVRLRSNPTDEIKEIEAEIGLFSIALLLLWLMIVGSLLWVVRCALRPLQLLAVGLDRMEGGDYRPIPPMPDRELHGVGRQFNHLAGALNRLAADNHLLIKRLLSVQEQERRQVAAELHDEFGPALFGIRAEAICILRLAADNEEQPRIGTHARAIGELTEGIQKVNSRMLERLRPLILEQMGLSHAIRELVASWQRRYPQIRWSLDLADDIAEQPEACALALYRVTQESLTNVVRHAHASAVDIRLERATGVHGESDSAARGIRLAVCDDGVGLSENCRYGFGLLGMTERVRQVGGVVKIINAPVGGVSVEAFIPAACLETTGGVRAHADTAA